MSASGQLSQRLQPFRFMDLPIELRLLVYEYLPRTVKHTHIPTATATTAIACQVPPEIILITRHVPTSILATSREVHKEASNIIKGLVRTFILEHEPRIFEIDASSESICNIMAAVSREWHILTAPYVGSGALPRIHMLMNTRVWLRGIRWLAERCGYLSYLDLVLRSSAYTKLSHNKPSGSWICV
jgi:hypothetical protein